MPYKNFSHPTPHSSKIPLPSMYEVVALRDEFTPDVFVAAIIVELFGVPKDSARNLTRQIRESGRVCLGVFTYEIADTKASLANDVARHEGHPLTLIIKPT